MNMSMVNVIKCNYIDKNRSCKQPACFSIKGYGICLCRNHLLLLYGDKITKIQRLIKGYLCRKKLRNIFYKLPNDIQRRVIYYMNEGLYFNRYYNLLNKIITNNTYKLTLDYYKINQVVTLEYIYNCYKLYMKYSRILSLNRLKILYILSSHIIETVTCYYVTNDIIGEDDMLVNSAYIYRNIDFSLVHYQDKQVYYIQIIDLLNQYKRFYRQYYNIKR